MAEPRRIDDNEAITPNVEEKRPPISETATRRPLLDEDLEQKAESEPILLPKSRKGAYVASNTEIEALSDGIEDGRSRSAEPESSDSGTTTEQPVSLFADARVTDYRSRWSDIQTAFVDEPRKAVEEADGLVKSVLNELSGVFTREREKLANQWERGDHVSTEDLRVTLQRYRSFFDRLLNV